MRVTASALVSAVLVVLASGCGSPSEPDAEGSQPSVRHTSDGSGAPSSADGGIDASYSVGDYELHLTCVGAASAEGPTIVYLHGLGGDGGDVNEALAPELAERGRLCTYDRVNVGLSGREDAQHTGVDSVEDLHTLLTAVDVPPPYLLVGFSFGGLIASMYAGTYPDDIEGVLMIDSSLPTDAEVDALIPPDERAQVIQDQQANGERVDFYATLTEATALVDSVPDVPITYLAARPVGLPPDWPVRRMRALISANQREFVDQFPQGRLVPVRSSHDIDLEQPELVIDEVDRLLGH
ncbi:alpha/beta fold hydrolase [Nocardioides astragali]|uniref:Alpha/beta fold hydrolase n=1 Tax=Nocardioides astragali TaxID=1776736 RepID=A0ABW2N5K0_9ACTN|nr:alpha/beta hydrolase [Nocardioides astragali]